MSPARGTRAIIPVAGVGSRLRPHTHTVPKALIHVAGRPILAHILDDLVRLGVEDVVLVIGHMGDRIREYVDAEFPKLNRWYVEQPERLGLGHAVRTTKEYVLGHPAFIVLGDTIFRADFSEIVGAAESRIGVKAVEDPRRFGIVEMKDGYASRLVEKPDQPTSNLAIVGVYSIPDSKMLFEALDTLVEKDIRTKGEYQLTDALQMMIERGETMDTLAVEGWFDCGQPDALLEANRHLLARMPPAAPRDGCALIPPVWLDPTCLVERSVLGPNVSVGARAVIRDAVLRDSIVGEDAEVERSLLESSLIGEHSEVRGAYRKLNLGNSSQIEIA